MISDHDNLLGLIKKSINGILLKPFCGYSSYLMHRFQHYFKEEPNTLQLESLLVKLNSEEYKSTDLTRNCLTLIESIKEVTSFAHEYDFDAVRANGFWTYIRLVYKFLNIVHQRLDSKTKIAEIELLSFGYIRFLDIIQVIRDHTKDRYFDHNRNEYVYEKSDHKSLFIAPSVSLNILYEEVNSLNPNDVKYSINLYTHFGTYWFCNSVKYFYKLYVLAVAFCGTMFPLSLKCVWNRKYRASRFSAIIKSPTDNYPFRIWDVINRRSYLLFESLLFSYGTPVKSSTVYITDQYEYVITQDGSLKINEKKPSSKNQTIRCRLLTNQKPKYLLLHCHGGGFVTHSPDCHETYLRNWSEKVPNMVILSVDYTLKANFPLPLQQVLDVYLWATSDSPDVIEVLGFKPEKIVLAGDSAGANLITSLLLILNDLRNMDNTLKIDIKMPVSVVSFYGAFLLSPLISPSRVMAANDPLISPSILLVCSGIYTGLVNKTETKSLLESAFSKVYTALFDQPKPWYLCNRARFEELYQTLLTISHIPYISPILYHNFDSLKDVKLYLITSDYCPFLDESVNFAKLWKGPVKLDVVEDLPHGFLNLVNFSPEAKSASNLCVQRISESLE